MILKPDEVEAIIERANRMIDIVNENPHAVDQILTVAVMIEVLTEQFPYESYKFFRTQVTQALEREPDREDLI